MKTRICEIVSRYAEIQAQQDKLKAEAEELEMQLLKESEEDLNDTKFKTVEYNDNNGNKITITNADTVKLIYPSMLKRIFGAAYSDVVEEKTTYTLSAPIKRLLSAVYHKEYIINGSIEQILDSLELDDKTYRTLAKKLKGANYENDVKNLRKLAGLSEEEARENAYLVSEAAAWQSLMHLLMLAEENITDESIAKALDLIDSAIVVERTPKTKFTASKK